MARVVRKISGKAVRGQKKGLLYSKKFWISTVAAVVAVVAIVLGLVFGLGVGKSDEGVVVPDYFAEQYTGTTKAASFKEDGKIEIEDVNYDFKFTKASYAEVMMRTNDNNAEFYKNHTFVFATDLSKFYPKTLMDKENDLKNETHANILEALILLQVEINQYNKSEEGKKAPAALYIVDTKEATGNANAGILTDANFGGAEGTTLLLSLISNEELVKDFKILDGDKKKTKTILCTTENGVQDSVNASRIFIRQMFVSAE